MVVDVSSIVSKGCTPEPLLLVSQFNTNTCCSVIKGALCELLGASLSSRPQPQQLDNLLCRIERHWQRKRTLEQARDRISWQDDLKFQGFKKTGLCWTPAVLPATTTTFLLQYISWCFVSASFRACLGILPAAWQPQICFSAGASYPIIVSGGLAEDTGRS
jgi:hypothetical protein